MTAAFVKHIGSYFPAKSLGTTIPWAWSSSSAAGSVIVACFVFDNAATASKPIVSSIDKPAGETANWVFLGASRSTSTSIGAFASGEMWAIKTTVAWTTPTITATLDTQVTMRSVLYSEYAGAFAVLRSTVGTAYSTSTTAASATTTGTAPQVGDLTLGLIFQSNSPTVPAGDNDTTAGSWSAIQGVGSTGAGAATNNMGCTQYKVLTAATHQTLNNRAVLTAGNGCVVAILQGDPTFTPPKINETLVDDFATQVNPATWFQTFGSPSWDAGAGGRLLLPETVRGTYSGVQSTYVHDMNESAVFLKVTDSSSRQPNTELSLNVWDSGSANGLSMTLYTASPASFLFRKRQASVNTDNTPGTVYDPVAMAWWRIRLTGGTAYWDTSPDAVTWTNRFSLATTLSLPAVGVELSAGQWGTTPATLQGPSYFDSLNVVPSGGQALTLDKQDSLAVTDAQTDAITLNRSDSEALTETSSAQKTSANALSVSDNLGSTDSETSVSELARSDVANLTDSFTYVLTPAVTYPKVETLTDDFSGDLAKWPGTYGGVVIELGRAKIPCTATYPALWTYPAKYDLEGSSISAQVTVPAPGTNREFTMETRIDAANRAIILHVAGWIYFNTYTATAGITHWSAPYNATTHAWWKAHSTGPGNIRFSTSADGINWVERASASVSWSVSSLEMLFTAGVWGGGSADDIAYVDNVNVTPPAVAPQLPGLAFWLDATTLALADGAAIYNWSDSSGMTSGVLARPGTDPPPHLAANALDGKQVVRFNGAASEFLWSDTDLGTVAHFIVVAKYSNSTFYEYSGLVGGLSELALLGYQGQTVWYPAPNSPTYYYNGADTAGARTAPMNVFALAAISLGTAYSSLKPNIGTDRLIGGRYWYGDVAEVLIYNRVLSDPERQAVDAYLTTKWLTPATQAFTLDITDSVALTDAPTKVIGTARSDTMALTETNDGQKTSANAVSTTDNLGPSDSKTFVSALARSDNVPLTDTVTTTAVRLLALTDLAAVTDSITFVWARGIDSSDALLVTDSRTTSLAAARVDNTGLTDALATTKTSAGAYSTVDQVGLTDSLVATKPTVSGRPKVHSGSAFAEKPGKVNLGAGWVEKPWKRWNGTAWAAIGAAVPTLDVATQAYMTATGLDFSYAPALDGLVVGLKAKGLWSKMIAIYPMIGGTAALHRWNLIDPRDLDVAYRLTFAGGVVSVHSTALGYRANPQGSTVNGPGFADTHLVPLGTMQQDSTHLSFYSTEDTPPADRAEMGNFSWFAGPERFHIIVRYVGANAYYYGMSESGASNIGVAKASGLFVATRTGPTAQSAYLDGVAVGQSANPSISLPTSTVLVGAIAGFANKTDVPCGFASIGSGLSPQNVADLYTVVQAYQTALGRAI